LKKTPKQGRIDPGICSHPVPHHMPVLVATIHAYLYDKIYFIYDI
jgi:hypothetical protein